MRLQAGVASDVGLVRQTNEDSYLVRRGLYAVCDGMGGARAGEIASEMACRGLMDLDPATIDRQALTETVEGINRSIAAQSAQEADLAGMGTTLTALVAGQRRLLVVHVGDSRAYLLRKGALQQVTEDHSWVGEMMRRGELTPAEAAVHPHRSVITKALGTEYEVLPDVMELDAEVGDRWLLCSDGLTGMVGDGIIERELGENDDPQTAAGQLVKAALAAGGEDNVTVVVVFFGPDDGTAAAHDVDEVLLGPVDRGSSSLADGVRSAAFRSVRGMGAAARGRIGAHLGTSAGRARRGVSSDPEQAAAASDEVPTTTSVDAEEVEEAETARATAPAAAPSASVASGAVASSVTLSPTGEQGKKRRRRWLIIAAVVVVILLVAVGGFAVFNSSVYYVGTYEGSVALYHGLPVSILGLRLSSVIEQGTVTYESLPPYIQERIDTRDLTTKEEGQRFLRSLSADQ